MNEEFLSNLAFLEVSFENLCLLCWFRDKLIEKEISVRFFGDLSYLPTKVQKLVAQIELLTKDYKK